MDHDGALSIEEKPQDPSPTWPLSDSISDSRVVEIAKMLSPQPAASWNLGSSDLHQRDHFASAFYREDLPGLTLAHGSMMQASQFLRWKSGWREDCMP